MLLNYRKKTFLTLLLLCFFSIASYRIYQVVVADIYASIAQQKFEAKDYAAAEHYLRKSLLHNDNNPEYYYLEAQALYARAGQTQDSLVAEGLLSQAQEHFLKSVELNPHEGNAWLDLAQACWWLSRFPGYEREYKNAESYFLKALETDPNNGKFLYAIVNYYLFSPKPEDCLPHLKRLAMVYPNAYHYLKGNPNWSDALRDSFKDGLKRGAETPLTGQQALSMLGFMAGEEKDWGSAIAYTEKLIRGSSADISTDSYTTLGRYCLQRPDQPRARTAFLQALKLSKNREQTLQSLLSTCIQANALDLYLDLCKETATFDTTVRNRLPLILGRAYFQGNDMEDAQRYFQQSVHTKETAEARRYLVEIALRKNDWDAAEINSQRATVLEPGNSDYHWLFARSLEGQKKYRQALEAIETAIRCADRPHSGYSFLQGSLHWALGDYVSAKGSWQTAHELAPQNVTYVRRIGDAYRMIGDLTNAEQYYLITLRLNPYDVKLREDLEAIRQAKP
jgi:tetratricopeptide (TPR) repeat protein